MNDTPKEKIDGRWITDARTGEKLRVAHVSEQTIIRDNVTTFGTRWNVAGVYYPDTVLKSNKDNQPGGKNNPLDRTPKGYISTEEARKILGSSASSARCVLHNHKVKHLHVKASGSPRLVWREKTVRALAAKRGRIVEAAPRGFLDSETARKVLGVGRSTLYRYEKKGFFRVEDTRLQTSRGTRHKKYYAEEDVMQLAEKTKAIRQLEHQLNVKLAARPRMQQPQHNHLTRSAGNTTPPKRKR